jgi:imidazole glycerol-phosphate synthase subunit HisF
MLRTRVIPCLLLRNESLVKTVQFNKYQYIGDPANTCRIFNELEVDELTFLDITASKESREPNYDLLSEIADECFMPVSYGGGISSLQTAEKILKLGFEKVVLNTAAIRNPQLISDIASSFGSQSVVVSIDVKRSFFGKKQCRAMSGSFNSRQSPSEWAKRAEELGAGEILLTSIDREGSWTGFDLDLIREVTDVVSIPVIANGGAASVQDIGKAVKEGGASAVGLGSMVVFQKKGMGVLVNFPDERELKEVLG